MVRVKPARARKIGLGSKKKIRFPGFVPKVIKKIATPGLPQFRIVKLRGPLQRFVPSMEIKLNESRLTGTKTAVRNPKQYNDLFKKGDRILYIHVESTSPKEVLHLVKHLLSPQVKTAIKNAGYSGMCGDTPNVVLAKVFEKNGATRIGEQIPPVIKARERARYLVNIATKSYPKDYLKTPITRIAMRV